MHPDFPDSLTGDTVRNPFTTTQSQQEHIALLFCSMAPKRGRDRLRKLCYASGKPEKCAKKLETRTLILLTTEVW